MRSKRAMTIMADVWITILIAFGGLFFAATLAASTGGNLRVFWAAVVVISLATGAAGFRTRWRAADDSRESR